MALIDCRKCGQQVSDRAVACPKCQWPPQKEYREALESVDLNGGDEETDEEIELLMPSSRLGPKLFMGAIVLVAIAVVGVTVRTVMEPSPQAVLERQLREGPSEETLRFLLSGNQSVRRAVVSEWSLQERERWMDYLAEESLPGHRSRGPSTLCGEAKFLGELRIWPQDRAAVLRHCESYGAAQKELQEVRDRNSQAERRYRDREAEVRRKRAEVDSGAAEVRSIERALYHFDGWIHGRLGPNRLEVSEVLGGRWGGERHVLRTTSTDFSTTGRFQMYVRVGGEVPVTLKNGRTSMYIEIIEADTVFLNRARQKLVEAQRELSRAERRLRETPRPETTSTGAYEQRVSAAEREVRRALAAVSVPAARPASSAPPVASARPEASSRSREVQERVPAPAEEVLAEEVSPVLETEPWRPHPRDVELARLSDYLVGPELRPMEESAVRDRLDFEEASPTAWQIYRRRVAAMRHGGKLEELARETGRLITLFPQHRELLQIELAEACEEAGDYACAERVYRGLLLEDPSARVLGRAAWFYATAPVPQGDHARGTQILHRATQEGRFNGMSAIAQAEILMHRGAQEQAERFLRNFLAENTSELATDYLAAIDEQRWVARERPREIVPVQTHKVPREWREGIPEGRLTSEERLFALVNEAIRHRQAERVEEAEELYWAALRRTELEDVRRTLHLGLGRVFEAAGRYDHAFFVYEVLLHRQPGDPDTLNRLAWALLTTESEEHRNRERGEELARRAAAASEHQDPSILDTLAEAYIQGGKRAQAGRLLERAVAMDPTRTYYQTRLREVME